MSKKYQTTVNFILILTVALITGSFAIGQTNDAMQLQTGKTIEKEMKGKDAPHNYSIDLKEKQFLDVTVEQRGIDLVLRLYSPAGQLFGEFDSPNGTEGSELLQIAAPATGRYRLEISPFATETPMAGSYALKIVAIRAATAAEREVPQMDKQFLQAWAAHDAATLERFLSNDFAYTSYASTMGGGMNRAAFLADQKRRLAAGIENITVKPVAVRMHDYGDAAVVTGSARGQYVNKNSPIEFAYGFTRTYIRRDNRWQLVAAHNTGFQNPATPIAADSKTYDDYAGEYQQTNDPSTKFSIFREGDKLMLGYSFPTTNGAPQTGKTELLPESASQFYTKDLGVRAVFIRDRSGQVTQSTFIPFVSSGTVVEMKKISSAAPQ